MVEPEEKSWRKISTSKYFVAGIITVLVFSLGLTMGLILEDHRYNLIELVNAEQETRYLSLQLQYLYLTSFSNYNNCPILETALKEATTQLDESLRGVIEYEDENEVNDKRKILVQRRYIVDNLRYWLLAKESKEKCSLDIVPIIYFHNADCPSCPNQGTILTYYKKIFGEQLLVFPINIDLRNEEPMVELVMNQFSIDSLPTLIVDNKKYVGVVRQEQLKEIICSSLKNSTKCQE